MWCGHCQQDVPAVAAAAAGVVQCARCQKPIERPKFAEAADHGATPDDQEPVKTSPRLDADELRWRRIGRTLKSAQLRPAGGAKRSQLLRFDTAQTPVERSRADTPRPVQPLPATPPRDPHRGSQIIAWMISLTGATTLGAGLGLIAWSLVAGRLELWPWGLFATLGGQGLLIIGLTMLLANLWTAARSSSGRLSAIQREVLRLQRSADALRGERSAGASRFYADVARGASVETLVANLRGQVDELSSSL